MRETERKCKSERERVCERESTHMDLHNVLCTTYYYYPLPVYYRHPLDTFKYLDTYICTPFYVAGAM